NGVRVRCPTVRRSPSRDRYRAIHRPGIASQRPAIPGSTSALRELRGAAGLVQTDLLALDFAGVAGHEASAAKVTLQLGVVFDQRAGDAQADGAGLAGDATAFDGDVGIELVAALGQLERLAHDHARGLTAEEESSGLLLTTMLPLPGRRNTRAAEDLDRKSVA